jgi:PQQ enzyme-like repeat protein
VVRRVEHQHPILSLSIEFGNHDTMFIGAGYLFAVDTRTGGCRWQYPSSAAGSAGSLLDMFDAPLTVGGGSCFTAADIPASNTITALAAQN